MPQVTAIARAAAAVACEGIPVQPFIMVPLVATAAELKHQAALVAEVVTQVQAEQPPEGRGWQSPVGTMIEVGTGRISSVDRLMRVVL